MTTVTKIPLQENIPFMPPVKPPLCCNIEIKLDYNNMWKVCHNGYFEFNCTSYQELFDTLASLMQYYEKINS